MTEIGQVLFFSFFSFLLFYFGHNCLGIISLVTLKDKTLSNRTQEMCDVLFKEPPPNPSPQKRTRNELLAVAGRVRLN